MQTRQKGMLLNISFHMSSKSSIFNTSYVGVATGKEMTSSSHQSTYPDFSLLAFAAKYVEMAHDNSEVNLDNREERQQGARATKYYKE